MQQSTGAIYTNRGDITPAQSAGELIARIGVWGQERNIDVDIDRTVVADGGDLYDVIALRDNRELAAALSDARDTKRSAKFFRHFKLVYADFNTGDLRFYYPKQAGAVDAQVA